VIPRAHITAWRSRAPWPSNEQIEQDLILSRALVMMFRHNTVASEATFRGGTALHKLFMTSPGRYSEDIDLVQCRPGPIGTLIGAIRSSLDPWLGEPRWKRGQGRFTLVYRFGTSFEPVTEMRLKVEVNTREHFSMLGVERRYFAVASPWFEGAAELPVYELDELLGTKMRALFQRKKGRDLFDLSFASERAEVDPDRVVRCFLRTLEHEGKSVSRAELEANLLAKLADPVFGADVEPLLAPGISWSTAAAARYVLEELAPRLPGEPWKGAALAPGP
jgi:predicted nucleotidyltransferase component of viral defense system